MFIAAGFKAASDIRQAEILIAVANATWVATTLYLSAAIMFSAIRLVRVLKKHHRKNRQSRNRNEDVKVGILKIQIIAAVFVVSLWTYTAMVLAWVITRKAILLNTVGSIVLGVPYLLLAGFTAMAPQILLIIK